MIARITVTALKKSFHLRGKKRLSISTVISQFFSSGKIQEQLSVIDGLSFVANPGELIGLIGKNGMGKTTLLRLIAQVYKPDQGTIQTEGKMVSLIDLKLTFRDQLTVTDVITLLLTLYQTQPSPQLIHKVLVFANLSNFKEAYLYQLSQGMTQRLTLTVALHAKADILLLDEVLESSDFVFRQKAITHLKSLARKGMTVIFISHDRDLIKSLCQKILVLEEKKLIAFVPIRQLTTYQKYL